MNGQQFSWNTLFLGIIAVCVVIALLAGWNLEL